MAVPTHIPLPASTDPLLILRSVRKYKRRVTIGFPHICMKDATVKIVKGPQACSSKVLYFEKVPSLLDGLIFVPTRKDSRSYCANRERKSLNPMELKLLASIILRGLHTMREEQTRKDQTGFHTTREYVDQIFIL